jgi:hypothetical protein
MKKKKGSKDGNTQSGFSLDSTLKVVGALVALAGLIFGIYQYINYERREARVELNKQRRALYEKATNIASRFAVSETQQEAEDLDRQFWTMYNGELGIVEDQAVKQAMQKFGGALKRWEKANAPPSDFLKPSEFNFQENGSSARKRFADLSYDLSQACREELKAP